MYDKCKVRDVIKKFALKKGFTKGQDKFMMHRDDKPLKYSVLIKEEKYLYPIRFKSPSSYDRLITVNMGNETKIEGKARRGSTITGIKNLINDGYGIDYSYTLN
jgi:hypothetical protein